MILYVVARIDPGTRDEESCTFVADFTPEIPSPHSFRHQLAEAFAEWQETHDGKQYVAENGCNWGDSLNIPDDVLERHGIRLWRRQRPKDAWTLVVDHDEPLI